MRKPNNKQRKGFTIVELVIVIAVVAVLAGVMIPTFGGIIETANRSADTQLVAQINTILFVEEELGGGVNDAVEIQKVIKENGLKLETKSKGQYIWYDIEAKKVVLAGLGENGIVLNDAPVESNNAIGYINADRPVLLDDGNDEPVIAEVPKGQYKAAVSPESFVQGYIFLSEKSADGLADAIHALRNPEGDDENMDATKTTKALTDALASLANIAEKGKVDGGARVHTLMQEFVNKTAFMTKHGTLYIGTDSTSVTKILVSSKMDVLTSAALSNLATTYPQLYVVDLHSDVIDIEDVSKVVEAGEIDEETRQVNGIYFVYCNDEIKAIDKDPNYNNNIENLIHTDERSQYISTFYAVSIFLDKNGNAVMNEDGSRKQITIAGSAFEYPKGKESHKVPYDFPHLVYGEGDKAYDLQYYSFDISGKPSIAIGTTDYYLSEDEQLKIDKGELVLYAIFKEVNADFKIGDICYSSAQATRMLANNAAGLPTGTTQITVISTTATLGSATETSLTIPSGVELLVPTKGYGTKEDIDKDGKATGVILLDARTNNYEKFLHNGEVTLVRRGSFVAIDKSENGVTGETQLKIAENVTLNVESGAKLYVDAVLYHCGTSYQGFIDDKCGVLVINDGAKIDSNGDITAYGIIRGDGELIANDGTVKEPMTIYDWYGGSNAAVSVGTKTDNENWWENIVGGIIDAAVQALKDMDLSGKGVCPFNEWKVDNIRAKTTLNSNSEYTAIVGIHLSKPLVQDNFTLASKDGTPLFKMGENASIVKTIENDGDVKLTLHGTVDDTHKTLPIENVVSSISVTIDFKKIPIPLSHLDVHVASDSILTISNNLYKTLPGSDIIVDGTLNIQGDAQVVMWNANDVKFVESWSTVETSSSNLGNTETETKTTITLIFVDGKIKSIATTTAARSRSRSSWFSKWGNWSDWSDKGTTTKDIVSKDSQGNLIYVAIPHKYSATTPAKLIVNGTLNFAGSAKFAGEITSTKAGATIKATSAVNGSSFPMGWFIQNKDIGNYWYDTYNYGLHSATVMVGVNNTAGTLAAGTYKYVTETNNGASVTVWQKQ